MTPTGTSPTSARRWARPRRKCGPCRSTKLISPPRLPPTRPCCPSSSIWSTWALAPTGTPLHSCPTIRFVPDDPVLSVTDRLVAITQPYQGGEDDTDLPGADTGSPAAVAGHRFRQEGSPRQAPGWGHHHPGRPRGGRSITRDGRPCCSARRPDAAPADLRIQPVMSTEGEKQIAAEAAADLVEDDMTVGLGTGSTVAFLLPALARRARNIRCAATSPRTEHAARELGLKVEALHDIEHFDVAIDGADQIAPDGWLVKGGGAALTREKIIAAAADRFVVIADSSKPVDELHG